MGEPAAKRSRFENQVTFPLKTVGFLGAPLIEGQNLEGADLAPLAMREAGFFKLLEKLGYDVVDHGDLDFYKRYAERGFKVQNHSMDKKLWHKWLSTSPHQSFAEWLAKTQGAPAHEEDHHEANIKKGMDPYDCVVNGDIIGTAVELIYEKSLEIVKSGHFLLTIGGDHSIAPGTIAAVCQKYKDLAIVWIDAHGDANTPESSPSLHYHGMPAAHLLGWFNRQPKGFEWMEKAIKGGLYPNSKVPGTTGKMVDESHFVYIGLRDIDPEEGRILKNSNIHIYTIRDVDKYGIADVMEKALLKIDPNKRRPLHVSLDIDAVDPMVAPGTGTMARGGLSYREIHYICEELAETRRLVSMDMVEINPGLDPAPEEDKMHGDDPDVKTTTSTIQLGIEVCLSSLGKTILEC